MAAHSTAHAPLERDPDFYDMNDYTPHELEPGQTRHEEHQRLVQSDQSNVPTTYTRDPDWGASDITCHHVYSQDYRHDAHDDDSTCEECVSQNSARKYEPTSQLETGEISNKAELWELPTRAVIERDFWWFFSWVLDVMMTFTPLVFIVIAAIALRLDHQPRSDLGERILEAERLGPTVFPIIFAAIVGKLCRNFSRWRLEQPRGIKLGMLEQISGSQSLSSAVDRVFTVRGTHVLSLCVVVVWALSPIGGQSSSRLLGEGLDPVISNSQVYFANPEYQSSTSDSASGWKDYKNVVYMVYSSVLFSVSSKRAALADPWDRPKLPQLSQAVIETSNFTWQEYDQQTNLQAGEDFASLLGVDIQGLRIDDPTMTSNFSIEMSYIDMDCKRAIAFKPLNSTYTSSFVATIVRNNDSSGAAWFWNNSRNGHRLSYDTRLTTDTGSHLGSTVFECVMRRIPVEAEIFCGPFPSTGCGVRRQRLRQAKSDPAPDGSYGTELDGMYQILPWSMGIPTLQNMVKDWPSAGGSTDVVEEASATDNFLAGDDFLYQSQHMRDWDSDATDMALFSRRMTTMFNTMFHATLDPWNATRSDLTRIPDTGNTTVDGYFYPNYTTTQATLTGQQSVYLANHPWCGLLLFIGSVVQLLAIASLCLRAIINAPDILGFASSFTRDNPYFPIRPSGSALGGAERARLLKDLRVQIADVIPTENVGYIAVRPVSDDLNNGGQPSVINSLEGQLQWRIRSGKRSYL